MSVTFLTPLAALFALAAAVPLAVAVRRERRAAAVRAHLGLARPGRRTFLSTAAALAAVPVLAAAAAAQPVLDLTEERRERTDAEAYVILDTSRSMLAAPGPDATSRIERARALTAALRDAFPDVPIGLGSVTDRTLPHLFPTTDRAVFASSLDVSVGIDQPPPQLYFVDRATDLGALAAVFRRNWFSEGAATRLLVVLTDGETREHPSAVVAAVEGSSGTTVLLVPTWGSEERVFTGGAAEPQYEADPGGPATLERLASESAAIRLVPEDAARLVAEAREALGAGPTRVASRDGREVSLMPYLSALVLLPLAVVFRRRNL